MTYQELAGSASCLRHYRGEEASGETAVDSGPQAIHGRYLGGPSTAEGRFGSGRAFTSGQVLQADGLRISQATNCTISAWVKWSDTVASQTLFVSEDTNRPLMFASTRGDELGMFLDRRGGFHGCGFLPTGLQPGEWHHFAVACDRSARQSRYYHNGIEVGVVDQEFLSDSGGLLHAGNLPLGGGANQPVGQALDDILVFDRVLSQAEIAELVSGPEPAFISPPQILSEVVAGQTIQRDPGQWDSQGNGPLELVSRVQSRIDQQEWHDLPGSEEVGYTVPVELAGAQVRLAVTASNGGGAAPDSHSQPRFVTSPVRYRQAIVAPPLAHGARSLTTSPTACAAALTVFPNQ